MILCIYLHFYVIKYPNFKKKIIKIVINKKIYDSKFTDIEILQNL